MKRIDIAVKAMGDEFPAEFILSHLFMALHGLLVKQKDEDGFVRVGVGFPEYDAGKPTLGRIMSLFGDKENLNLLGLPGSIPDLRDFIRISGPVEIVSPGKYTAFRKIKPKGALENKIRRAMKRHGYTREEAERMYLDYQDVDRHSKVRGLPYMKVHSQSTGQAYPVYIKSEEASGEAEKFNTFGLQVSGNNATRPKLGSNEHTGGVPV